MKLSQGAGIAGLFFLGLTLSQCTGWNRDRQIEPPTAVKDVPSSEDLLAFQQQAAMRLDSLIATRTQHWESRNTTGTGIRWEKLDSNLTNIPVHQLQDGTVLELYHRLSLLDGQVITDWPTDGPMAFEPGSTDVPSGFHELIDLCLIGDSVHALIPPIRAWGMSGLPPDIPQEAIIEVHMRVGLYKRPT